MSHGGMADMTMRNSASDMFVHCNKVTETTYDYEE